MTKPQKIGGWESKLDELIDNDYWSYPKDERSMIFTTVKIKDFIHQLLIKTKDEACQELLNEVMEEIEVWKSHSEEDMDDLIGRIKQL